MEGIKENNIARIGCGIFIVYVLVVLGALIHILFMSLEPSSWFEIKSHSTPIVIENCDSILRVKCDSLGIDYNTIGTTTDPD